jgi:hypothetical protein
MTVLTDQGRGYSLQYKDSLSDTNWADVPGSTFIGDGFDYFIMDFDAPSAPRFYRLRADSHP